MDIFAAHQWDTFQRIHRMGKPVIAVDFEENRSVNIDNEASAYVAATHAIPRRNCCRHQPENCCL